MDRSCTSIKIIIFLLLISQYACKKPSYKYGVSFNSVRETIGLPLINDDWRLYKHGIDFNNQNFLVYINPKVNTSWDKVSPIHYSKSIRYTNDTIISEADTYFSGETFETVDAKINVSLIIKYYFKKDTSDEANYKKGWNYTLFNSPENSTYGKNISKPEVDSLLSKWGFYKNYKL